MKVAAVVCNVVLFLFTCMVLVTDGMAKDAIYVVFTFLLLLMPVVNVAVLLRGAGAAWLRPGAVIGNILLVASTVLAIVDQYPHPNEEGFVAYLVVLLLTPILSALVLLRGGRSGRPHNAPAGSEALP